MEVLREIQKLSDEEVEEYCKERIQLLEDYYGKYRDRSLGYDIDYNSPILYLKESDYTTLESKCFYGGYIPLGTKIIFGFVWNGSNYTNAGLYYYLDDASYILEFVKFVREKEINNEYELFDCIFDFLNHYFDLTEIKKKDYIDRDNMCKLISKTSTSYYAPVKEHSIKMFKGKGNALCTEKSIIAQNILSFLNFESYVVIGLVDNDGKGGSEHAFNLITYIDSTTGERLNSLIDFSLCINRIDINHRITRQEPYMIDLDSLDDNYAKEFLSGNSKIEGEKYGFLDLEKLSLYLRGDSIIKYYIEDNDPKKEIAKVFKKMRGEADGNNR